MIMLLGVIFVIFFGTMYIINKIYKTGDKTNNEVNEVLLNDVENIV